MIKLPLPCFDEWFKTLTRKRLQDNQLNANPDHLFNLIEKCSMHMKDVSVLKLIEYRASVGLIEKFKNIFSYFSNEWAKYVFRNMEFSKKANIINFIKVRKIKYKCFKLFIYQKRVSINSLENEIDNWRKVLYFSDLLTFFAEH